VVFFFFQAEDGIRDFHVTGVQTCALPILPPAGTGPRPQSVGPGARRARPGAAARRHRHGLPPPARRAPATSPPPGLPPAGPPPEIGERRVGEECRARGAPPHSKTQLLDEN